MNPKVDNTNLVVNAEETYHFLGSLILQFGSCLISWTDGDSTQFDILFTMPMTGDGGRLLQGGIHPGYLYVSIMRLGAFAFEWRDRHESSRSYYAEKLLNDPDDQSVTSEKLAELLNGVRKFMFDAYNNPTAKAERAGIVVPK